MPSETLLAGVALFAVIAYGILAGADFGGGIWDILASGPHRDEQRPTIARAMGPVWEANHVWLIFLIVILFSGFPPAYAALSVGLFAPLHLVLLGITLRGGAFVFRAHGRVGGASLVWGAVFGGASVITPVLLGMSLGAVSAGNLRIHDGVVALDGPASWTSPISIAMGLLALSICAYLAAVFLTNETTGALQEIFRSKALVAGTFVVALAALAVPLTRYEAEHLYFGLTSARGAGVIGVGVLAALLSGWALLTRRFRLARRATVVQVAFLLGGWGVAQYPYLIYPDLTLAAAAAPEATIRFVLWTLPFGAAVLAPSIWFLFKVFKSAALKS
jgi:cytochrome d ubiquinol oxidase subunit II